MTLLRPDTRHASLSQLTASPSQPLHFTAPVCTSLYVHSHFIRGCGNTSFPSFVSALTVCTLEGLPLGDNLPACLTFSCFFHCVQLYCCSGRHPRVETILPSAFAMNSWTNAASVSWHNWHEWSERTSDRCTLSLFTVSRDESFLASHVKSLLSLLGRTTSTEQSRGPTQPCSTRSSFSSAPCSAWSSLGEAGSSRIFFFV